MTTPTPARRASSASIGRLATLRVLAVVSVMSAVAFAGIVHLHRSAEASSRAEMRLAGVARELQALQYVPFSARHRNGGNPLLARERLRNGESRVRHALAALQREHPLSQLQSVPEQTQAYFDTLHDIYLVGISPRGYGPLAERLGAISGEQLTGINQTIDAAAHTYAVQAGAAQDDVLAGSGTAIALLYCAFAFFQHHTQTAKAESERLAEENGQLLDASRNEARTDPLTGLRNRRALVADLAAAFECEARCDALLILFDLDGFKQYNDTFGHPAGDLLLQRLAHRLEGAVAPLAGTAYRMGGDEFCVLVPADEPERAVWATWTALAEHGDAFEVGASYGVTEIPGEATSVAMALHLADVRLYDDKAAGRPSADRQTTDVLMALINERGAHLREHVERVAALTELLARRVGLSDTATRQAVLAARLHDVGKAAIPETIVSKPGSLDPAEWEFIHRHTVIGEQIIAAAPALKPVAEIVRATHERFDGTGYPDRLGGDDIPVAARIISVCDAYDTMINESVYQPCKGPADAVAELRRNAGTQFDPHVVDAFCAASADRLDAGEQHAA